MQQQRAAVLQHESSERPDSCGYHLEAAAQHHQHAPGPTPGGPASRRWPHRTQSCSGARDAQWWSSTCQPLGPVGKHGPRRPGAFHPPVAVWQDDHSLPNRSCQPRRATSRLWCGKMLRACPLHLSAASITPPVVPNRAAAPVPMPRNSSNSSSAECKRRGGCRWVLGTDAFPASWRGQGGYPCPAHLACMLGRRGGYTAPRSPGRLAKSMPFSWHMAASSLVVMT